MVSSPVANASTAHAQCRHFRNRRSSVVHGTTTAEMPSADQVICKNCAIFKQTHGRDRPEEFEVNRLTHKIRERAPKAAVKVKICQ